MPASADSPNFSGHQKLAGLDHLRALAIVLVLLFHYRLFEHPQWVVPVGRFGWTGVDLFFVLSGYLISSQLLKKIANEDKISFKDFFIRRFFRIIPAYLSVVAVYFCIPFFREWEALPPLWKFLTFTQNLGLNINSTRTFSHAWSLCIEEQFYLLLPLTLIGLVYVEAEKRGALLISGLFVFGLAARIYCWYHFVVPVVGSDEFVVKWYQWIYYPTWGRLDGLLTGISIAALFQFRLVFMTGIARYGNALLLASIVILSCAYCLCFDAHTFVASVFGFPLVSVGYGVLVMAAISPSCFLYKLRSALTEKIAAWSFAIYLVHKGMIHIAQLEFAKLGVAVDGNVMFLICIVSSLVGAALLNVIIEKPFMRLRKKITG